MTEGQKVILIWALLVPAALIAWGFIFYFLREVLT